jgi:hypothetical protein
LGEEQVASGRHLSSATDCKPHQRAADDQHDDHDQNEFTDTGDKASVKVHLDQDWAVLYVSRWLVAPIQQADGSCPSPGPGSAG